MKKREVLFLIVLVVLDQLTKYIASVCLTAGKPVEVIRNFFYLTLVHNTGAAWSILEGQMWFFYILTAVMLAVFFMYLMKTDKKKSLQLSKKETLIYLFYSIQYNKNINPNDITIDLNDDRISQLQIDDKENNHMTSSIISAQKKQNTIYIEDFFYKLYNNNIKKAKYK